MNPDVFEKLADGSVLIRIKAVPGASCNQITGVRGGRLKIRVAAPPEGGKANQAICDTVARALSIKSRQVEILKGRGHAEKTLKVTGVDVDKIEHLLRSVDS